MSKFKKYIFLIFTAMILVMFFVFEAQAESISFELDHKYCGADEPQADSPPWLIATFDDEDSPGTVNLTLDSYGLGDQEYIAAWYFNLNPALDASKLIINHDENSYEDSSDNKDIYDAAQIYSGNNMYHAASNRDFDILFDFTQCAGTNASQVKRFNKDIILEYSITGIEGLSASSFYFLSEDKGNADRKMFYSAAHILRIDMDFSSQNLGLSDNSDKGCGWIAVPAPEPCTMFLLGSGLIGLAGIGRRLKQ